MDEVAKTIVTKAQYALLKKRTPSSVSNWITAGKISKAALIGEGRGARIWAERADSDLALSLDPSQQAAQNKPVEAPAADVIEFAIAKRFREAKAKTAEYEAEAAYRRLMVDAGRWIDAEEAAKVWARELTQVLDEFERFILNIFPRKLAEQYGLDWKDLSIRIRKLWYAYRSELADQTKSRLENLKAERTQPNDRACAEQGSTS